MRALLVIIAAGCSLLIAVGCIAEGMGMPSNPPPMMYYVDWLLAVFSLLCSGLAWRKPSWAATAIWTGILLYAVLDWKIEGMNQLLRGIAKFAVLAAFFITSIVVTEKYYPQPE